MKASGDAGTNRPRFGLLRTGVVVGVAGLLAFGAYEGRPRTVHYTSIQYEAPISATSERVAKAAGVVVVDEARAQFDPPSVSAPRFTRSHAVGCGARRATGEPVCHVEGFITVNGHATLGQAQALIERVAAKSGLPFHATTVSPRTDRVWFCPSC